VAHAATITVDGSSCTLAQAITAANTDTATGGCIAGDGADTVDLQADVILAAGLPAISSEMTLQGNGHTIDGDDGVAHVLHVDNALFTLNEAVITGGNGDYGGGIYNNNGAVTVNESTITGNAAAYSGGGVFNYEGSMTVNNSTISGNTGPYGGGIANFDTLTVSNSTISANTGNAGGGLYSGDGSFVTLNRSIISGNSAVDEADEIFHSVFEADLIMDNDNVLGYGGSARSQNVTPGPSDVVPGGALNTVLNADLADNGGLTPTHALVAGSEAIDIAPDAACMGSPIDGVDQRDYARNTDGDATPSAAECDAGAFEFNSEPTAIDLGVMHAHSATSPRGLLAAIGAAIMGLLTLGNRLWRRRPVSGS
jgi:hypothetical protein